MSVNSDLTGDELLKLSNSKNTRQFKDVPLDELADWIKDQDLTADVLMIALLTDISLKLNHLHDIEKNTEETVKELKNIQS